MRRLRFRTTTRASNQNPRSRSEVAITNYAALADIIRALIRDTGAKHELAGYALCTDDELRSLFVARIPAHPSPNELDDDTLYSPMDWPDLLYDGPTTEPSTHLQRLADSTTSPTHVEDAFEALVAALEHAKRTGLFSESTYLTVLSTDPSEHLEALSEAAEIRLNSRSIVEGRQSFLKRWK